jgi:Ethylbenzene dehydrogenase
MSSLQGYVLIILVALTSQAMAVDWAGVQGKDITLFYPGQASWEWVLTQSSHSGAKKFRGGKNCRDCHSGEEADIGALIVSGEKLEPDPIPGKPGSIQVNVKAAHDAEMLYVRIAWPIRSTSVADKQDPDFESRITMMLGDANVKEATRAGCWGACHADLSAMPTADDDGEGIRKYLSRSRTKLTRQGGGRNYKSPEQLQALIDAGYFLEYWQGKISEGKAVAVSGFVLDARKELEKPISGASAEVVDGQQVVILSRVLIAADPQHKDIVPATTYAVGFALHESYASERHHFVSFEHSLTLDKGEADLVAVGL